MKTREQLKEDFAYMFEGVDERYPIMMFEFEFSDGWNDLVYDALFDIAALDVDNVMRLSQVKEKFGTLRMYFNGYPDNIYKEVCNIITDAEQKSEITCEICGKPGKVRGKYWVKCLCDECSKRD